MARGEFGMGLLLGGLAGVAIGYLVTRSSDKSDQELSTPETIDLTPALHRGDAGVGLTDDPGEAHE